MIHPLKASLIWVVHKETIFCDNEAYIFEQEYMGICVAMDIGAGEEDIYAHRLISWSRIGWFEQILLTSDQ